MSSQTFADLGVSSAVLGALTTRGIKEPFPIQRLAVPDVLAGRDVLVKSPTGSGKTLAFGVPIVDLIEATDPRPSALVLAPTRELALQIVEDMRPLAHARALSIAPSTEAPAFTSRPSSPRTPTSWWPPPAASRT